jgi:hypothetical protein
MEIRVLRNHILIFLEKVSVQAGIPKVFVERARKRKEMFKW